MSVLKSLAGGACVVLALSGALRAEATAGQTNTTGAELGAGITQLLGDERSAMNGVAQRFDAVAPRPDVKLGNDGAIKLASASPSMSELDYSNKWVSTQPIAQGGEQFQCLADVLYFEARGESVAGQAAVAEVVLNRVESSKFPGTICGVVHQSSNRGCQFSWTCDGKADRVHNQAAYAQVAKVARAMMDGAPRKLTDGATYFHTPAVRPAWAKRFTRTTQIGSHIFYRPRIRTASN